MSFSLEFSPSLLTFSLVDVVFMIALVQHVANQTVVLQIRTVLEKDLAILTSVALIILVEFLLLMVRKVVTFATELKNSAAVEIHV